MDTPFPILSTELLDQSPAATPAPAPAPVLSNNSAQSAETIPRLEAAQALAPAKPAAPPAELLRHALALAIESSPQVMENLAGRALLSLDRKSTANPNADERAQLDSAALAMDSHRRRWIRQFPALLRIACAHPLPPDQASLLPAVDMRICEQELAQLSSVVQSLGSQRGNPLGPQSYVRAICELVARSEGNAMQRQHWQAYLLAALGTQLAWVYPQLLAMLQKPGSREISALSKEPDFADFAAFTFGLGGKAPPPLEPVAAPPMPISPEMRALALEARRTVEKMREVLGLPETQPGDLPGGMPMDEMSRMMRDIEESERLMVMMNERGLQMPELDNPEADEEKLVDQVDRLLSDFRNRTSPSLARVPQLVRDALQRMQEPLVRLAQLDGSLLKQDEHPARLLLDEVSKRSLVFSQEDPKTNPAFAAFLTAINKLFDALVAVAQPSSKIYAQAKSKMQPVWLQMDELQKQSEDRKERDLAQLEVRKQLASRLAFELVSRSDAGDAPVPIKQFLMGPWAQVLARAQLHPQYPQDEPRYMQAAAVLLWSVSVRRAGGFKDRLVAEIPDLIKQVKAGMLSVQVPQGNIDAFITDLKKLHDAVINADVEPGDPDDDDFPIDELSAESMPADLSDMMMLDEQRKPPAAPSYQSDLNLL
jgi:Protein of unknown function (DUF1631)